MRHRADRWLHAGCVVVRGMPRTWSVAGAAHQWTLVLRPSGWSGLPLRPIRGIAVVVTIRHMAHPSRASAARSRPVSVGGLVARFTLAGLVVTLGLAALLAFL